MANGGGRDVSHAESLVRIFNLLILVSTVLTPFFGRFVDVFGMPSAFLLVNGGVPVRGVAVRCPTRSLNNT